MVKQSLYYNDVLLHVLIIEGSVEGPQIIEIPPMIIDGLPRWDILGDCMYGEEGSTATIHLENIDG